MFLNIIVNALNDFEIFIIKHYFIHVLVFHNYLCKYLYTSKSREHFIYMGYQCVSIEIGYEAVVVLIIW